MRVYLDNCCYNRPFDEQTLIIKREPFDYTEWQRGLYEGVSLDEFYANIKQFRANKKETP